MRSQVEDRLLSFSAEHAKCFLDDDRHRLLGIIETGFGDYDAFNTLVRTAAATTKRTHARAAAARRACPAA